MALLPAVILYGTLLPLGLFVLCFGLRSSWYTSKTGRMLMGLALGLVSVLLMGLLQRYWGPDWMDALRVVVYGLLHIGVWRLFYTLRIVQRTNCDGTREPMDVQRAWAAITKRRARSEHAERTRAESD